MTESESIEVAKLSNENQFIDDEYETERQRIHNQLSTMSFEDLQKLKDDMGSKLYNKTVFGDKQTRKEITFKRANKNRPREMTSKKHLMPKDNFIPVKKHFALDPRFEPMCGTFDKKAFKSNYKFLNDLRKKEKNQLESDFHQTNDFKLKKKIKFVMQRLDNKIREEDKNDKQEQHQLLEKEETKIMLKEEKVFFKKKSVKRLESLINQFEDLKKSNKLQKHIERRDKKISARDHKKFKK
ncbi:unnamed protein product [Tenebrio molitor]|jgi:ribosomal RNA-processing protein 36|nr:unnamed protein product [Tenebrio molitor]